MLEVSTLEATDAQWSKRHCSSLVSSRTRGKPLSAVVYFLTLPPSWFSAVETAVPLTTVRMTTVRMT